MISRHWIGIIKKEKLSEYLTHLDNIVMPNLRNTSGMVNCYYLKRVVREGIEFLIVTEWESVDAIIRFAGTEYEKAVIDPFAKSLMVSYDKKVRHYTI